MIYLIHGENIVDSRRALIKLKLDYEDIQTLSSKKISEDALKEKSLQASKHLFGGKSALLVENFSGDWKSLPTSVPDGLDIILWSGKNLKPVPPQIKSLPFDSAKNFSTFKFSDALLYKNEKQAFEILGELLEKREPPEKIIGALNRGLSLLYAYKLADSLPISSFVLEKVKLQAKYWTTKEIKKAFLSLLKADLEIKEGSKVGVVFSSLVGNLTT